MIVLNHLAVLQATRFDHPLQIHDVLVPALVAMLLMGRLVHTNAADTVGQFATYYPDGLLADGFNVFQTCSKLLENQRLSFIQ